MQLIGKVLQFNGKNSKAVVVKSEGKMLTVKSWEDHDSDVFKW